MENLNRNVRDILANTSLFGMLDKPQLELVASGTRCIRVKRHACVVNRGDVGAGVFWVVYGQVRIACHVSQGNEKTVAILGQDKCFGLGEMMLEKPHLAFVETTIDSMLLHTRRDVVLQAAAENFELSKELMVCLSRQFYTLARDIEAYSLHTARQRLAGYLLRQSEDQKDASIELVANKSYIASRLNLSPETLSRLFGEFSDEGMLAVSGRHIQILDHDKLGKLLK